MNDQIFFDGVSYSAVTVAAEKAGISSGHLSTLCREGKVKARQAGRRWYVEGESLQAFLVARAEATARRAEQLAQERAEEYQRLNQTKKIAPVISSESPKSPSRFVPLASMLAVAILMLGTFVGGDALYSRFTGSHLIPYGEVAAAGNTSFWDWLTSFWKGDEEAVVYVPAAPEKVIVQEKPVVTVRPTPIPTPVATPRQTTVVNNYPIIERIVERALPAYNLAQGGVTEDILTSRLSQLQNTFSSQMLASSIANTTQVTNVYQAAASIGRIEHLDELDLTNPTITRGSVTGSSVSATSLAVSGSGTSTFSNGLDISDGCFAVDGVCISGIGSGSSFGQSWEITGGYLAPTSSIPILVNNASSTITNLVTVNATSTNATSTTLFATTLQATNATTTNLFSINASTTNSTSTNSYSSSLIASNATSTSFFSAISNFTSSIIANLTATIAVITNLTATNLIATNATTTNATTTNLTIFNAPLAPYFIATSTTASIFPYASSTALSVSGLLSLGNVIDFTGGQATTSLLNISGRTYFAASTTISSIYLGLGAGTTSLLSGTGADNFGVGLNALSSNTGGVGNNAIGLDALKLNTGGNINNAIGYLALTSNTTGSFNNALGYFALNANTEGSYNNAIGNTALQSNTVGTHNNAIGTGALNANTSGIGNNAIGYRTLFNTTGFYNNAFGFQAGYNVTTGYSNTLLGDNTQTTGGITTGGGNIGLGANVFFPSQTANRQLNIGNLIFGTLPATSTALQLPTSGSVGVGSTSPFAKFSIHTNNGDTAKSLFAIGSSTASATTTHFLVTNAGAVGVGSTTPWSRFSIDTSNLATGVPSFVVGSSTKTDLYLNQNKTLGLGTSTVSGWSAHNFALEGDTTAIFFGQAGDLHSTSNAYNDSAGWKYRGASTAANTYIFGGGFNFRNAASGAKDATITWVDRFNITAAGNVGVGSTTPWATFAVNPIAGAASNQFVVGSTTATTFVINNSGRVGIATTSPWRTFSVNGTVAFQGIGVNSADNDLPLCWNSTTNEVRRSAAVSTCQNALDVAEHYGTEEPVVRGEIVMLGTTVSSREMQIINPNIEAGESETSRYKMNAANVRKAVYADRDRIIGAIPTAPFVIDRGASSTEPVALVGHVPIRMTLDGGNIYIGDPITVSSSTPGAGMKAATSGRIVGYALENFTPSANSEDGMIEVYVKPQDWLAPEDVPNSPGFIEGLFTRLTAWFADAGNGIEKIFAKELVAVNITADQVNTKKLCIDDVCIMKDELQTILQRGGVAGAATSSESTSGGASPESATSTSEVIAPHVEVEEQVVPETKTVSEVPTTTETLTDAAPTETVTDTTPADTGENSVTP